MCPYTSGQGIPGMTPSWILLHPDVLLSNHEGDLLPSCNSINEPFLFSHRKTRNNLEKKKKEEILPVVQTDLLK